MQESAAHSWYDGSKGRAAGLHPHEGETTLRDTGPKPPYEPLDFDNAWSWLMSPR